MALAFGIKLPAKTRRDRDAAIDAVCDYLEITPNQRERLGEGFQRLLPALRALTTDEGEGWLELPQRVSHLLTELKPLVSQIKRLFTRTRQEKLRRILERPHIPPPILKVLAPIMLARASRLRDGPASELRSLCLTLLRNSPQMLGRALHAYRTQVHSLPGAEIDDDEAGHLEASPAVESAWEAATQLLPELVKLTREGTSRRPAKKVAPRTKKAAKKKAKAKAATTGRSKKTGSSARSR